jgi:two-component system response regulator GlrR
VPHHLLLVEQTVLSLEDHLGGPRASEQEFRCERVAWDSSVPARVRTCTADMILLAALPESAPALHLFEWVQAHPVTKPIFAILPDEGAETLLAAASDVAADFILWPAGRSELRLRLLRILGKPEPDLAGLHSLLSREMGLANLLGNDPAFLRMVAAIPLAARSDSPVLITGETGTGKELCARAIHHLGRRKGLPFIAADCGAFPDHLFENELFGHARGAFTDAHGDQKGLVALAEGGTLFLDEVDALSPSAQAKLLRFLQERTYKPLGAERFSRADIRILAATNRDLETCVREKRFREDLFFRLNVLRLQVLPLRERRGDIELLARSFLDSTCRESALPAKIFSPSALRKLVHYGWPGNVRELINMVQRAVVFSPGVQILASHIPLPEPPPDAAPETFRHAKARAVENFERVFVDALMRKHLGNVTRAAHEAQKDRRAFGRLVKKHKLSHRVP